MVSKNIHPNPPTHSLRVLLVPLLLITATMAPLATANLSAEPPVSDDNCLTLPVGTDKTRTVEPTTNDVIRSTGPIDRDTLLQKMAVEGSIISPAAIRTDGESYEWNRWNMNQGAIVFTEWGPDGQAKSIHYADLYRPVDDVTLRASYSSNIQVIKTTVDAIEERLDLVGSSPWSILCQTGGVVCETLVTTTAETRLHAEGTVEFWALFLNLFLAGGTKASAAADANVDSTVVTNVDSRIECSGPSSQWTMHGGGGVAEMRRGHAYMMTTDVQGKYSECTYDNLQLTYFGILHLQSACETDIVTLNVDSLASVAKRVSVTPICHVDSYANRPLDAREVPTHLLSGLNPIQKPHNVGLKHSFFHMHAGELTRQAPALEQYRASVQYGELSLCIDPAAWPVINQ